MKKAGIVADNYKLEKFKKELMSAGFDDFNITPFTEDTSTIQVNIGDDQMKAIQRICQQVEIHFKQSS